MQPAVETAPAHHVWNVTMFTQILARQTEVPFEIQHRNDGGRHYFGIRHLTLLIFIMLQAFQQIITQAKNDYNLRVHEFLLYSRGWDTSTVSQTHGLSYSSYST